MPNRSQPEIFNPQAIQRQKEAVGSIISGFQHVHILHLTAKESVECGHTEATEQVMIGIAEEILYGGDVQPSLLLHLARHSLLKCLANICESTGQVECALSRLPPAPLHEQPPPIIGNEGHCGRTGIQIIDEATVSTAAAFFVVIHKVSASTYGAARKFV